MIKKSIARDCVQIQDKICLKPYQKGYEEAFFQLVRKNFDRLQNHFPSLLKKNESIENTKTYIDEKIKLWNKCQEFAYMIFNEQEIIGHFNIKDIDWKKKTVELAYWIDSDSENKGIVTNIVKNRINYIFSELDIIKIIARCHVENMQSEKIMQKCGMHYEGTVHNLYKNYQNISVDTYLYSIENNIK